VDTSVWIDHFQTKNHKLAQLLESELVLMHPFVFGEIALGQQKNKARVLSDLGTLKVATMASDPEVVSVIDRFGLAGSGVGYIDAHLLASAMLTGQTHIWTHDRRMNLIAQRMALDAKLTVAH
jgi:predicted nucleic acid-binding protein